MKKLETYRDIPFAEKIANKNSAAYKAGARFKRYRTVKRNGKNYYHTGQTEYFKNLKDLQAGKFFAVSDVKNNPSKRRKPRPKNYDTENLVRARDLYERFTGHPGKTLMTVPKPVIPNEGLVIGKVLGIMYETVRDGRREKYRHLFAARSRPLFVVSHDGKQLLMIGGSFDFTERGIVDK